MDAVDQPNRDELPLKDVPEVVEVLDEVLEVGEHILVSIPKHLFLPFVIGVEDLGVEVFNVGDEGSAILAIPCWVLHLEQVLNQLEVVFVLLQFSNKGVVVEEVLQKGDYRILLIDTGRIGVFRTELGVLNGVGVGGVEVIEETVEIDLAHQIGVG